MVRNSPKNKTLPAVKADMAKRIMSSKSYVKTPEGGGRRKIESEHGGKLVWGSKHGATSKNLTMRKDKHFKGGAMGQQMGQVGKGKNKVGGGWEISHE